jgi:hypothetical protein
VRHTDSRELRPAESDPEITTVERSAVLEMYQFVARKLSPNDEPVRFNGKVVQLAFVLEAFEETN